MRTVWAVARQTFSQCIRMKIAVMFIIVLGILLAVLPTWMLQEQNPLSDRIRLFLSYGTGATQALLIIIAIFASTSVVSSDIQYKQIFTLATKPLGRSQYVIGRWLGVVMLCSLLLVLASATSYAITLYLHSQKPINLIDLQATETEVFAARQKLPARAPAVEQAVADRIKQAQDTGQIEGILGQLEIRAGTREAAEKMYRDELTKQELERAQSVAPGGTTMLEFEHVNVEAPTIRQTGTVRQRAQDGSVLRISVPRSLVGQLVTTGPIEIGSLQATVLGISRDWDFFDAQFDPDIRQRVTSHTFDPGQNLDIVVRPAVQFSYKLEASNVPNDILKSRWSIVNPDDPASQWTQFREDPPGTQETITIPAALVSRDGRINIVYQNLRDPRTDAAPSVTIPRNELSLLYRAGQFDGNFLRGQWLILLQVMFFAALGVLAGTFASFPVAVMVCFAVLPFAMAGEFLVKATAVAGPAIHTEPTRIVSQYIMTVMRTILPRMSDMTPGTYYVGGILIPWRYVAAVSAVTIFVHTFLFLAIGCLVFRHRELARVQA